MQDIRDRNRGEQPGGAVANCDAVYVASPHYTHFEYAKAALEAGKDVFCETPFVLHLAEAKELYAIAEAKRRTLMVAHKTAYCPAFRHLVTMLKSGVIGKIVDINASVTTLTDERFRELDHNRFGGSMNENACFPLLPILKLLGQDVRNINFYSIMKNDVAMYTKAVFRYDNATASFQVGLGAKTERQWSSRGPRATSTFPPRGGRPTTSSSISRIRTSTESASSVHRAKG